MPEARSTRAWRVFVSAALLAALPLVVLAGLLLDELLNHDLIPDAVAHVVVVVAPLPLAVCGGLALIALLRQVRARTRAAAAEDVVGTLQAGDRTVRVVRHPEALAYCRGWVRPVVVVSDRTVADLDPAALQALLVHEGHHAARRDPLRLLVGRVLVAALPYAPVLRVLLERFAQATELRADAVAVEEQRAVAPLARALDRFVDGAHTGVAPWRVDALLGRPVRTRRLPARGQLTLAALAVGSFGVTAIAMVDGHGPAELVALVWTIG